MPPSVTRIADMAAAASPSSPHPRCATVLASPNLGRNEPITNVPECVFSRQPILLDTLSQAALRIQS